LHTLELLDDEAKSLLDSNAAFELLGISARMI